MEEFLRKNSKVPNNKQNLITVTQKKTVKILPNDFAEMYEDVFDMEEPFDWKKTKIQKYKFARQTFLKAQP